MLNISIHALCEEGDGESVRRTYLWEHFYPRPLRGGRRYREMIYSLFHTFLSTPSARRATLESVMLEQTDIDFYPRPLRGGRRGEQKVDLELAEFLSTPSARRATAGRSVHISQR